MTDLIEKAMRKVWALRCARAKSDGVSLDAYDTMRGDEPIAVANGTDKEVEAVIQTVLTEMMEPTTGMISSWLKAERKIEKRSVCLGVAGPLFHKSSWRSTVRTFAKQHNIQLGEEDGQTTG